MATQYSYENMYSTPEFEFQVEEMRKRLKSKVANFAQVRFRCAMKMQLPQTEQNV